MANPRCLFLTNFIAGLRAVWAAEADDGRRMAQGEAAA